MVSYSPEKGPFIRVVRRRTDWRKVAVWSIAVVFCVLLWGLLVLGLFWLLMRLA